MGGSSSQKSVNDSQSQGYQMSEGGSQSSSQSGTRDSDMSRMQVEILKSREAIFESDFIPNWRTAYDEIDTTLERTRGALEDASSYGYDLVNDNLALLDNALADITENSSFMQASMALQSNQINNVYQAAQKQTAQNLAKQNLLGNSNGVSASLKAQNDRARSGALAQAYYATTLQNEQQKNNLLALRNQAVNTGIANNQSLLDTELAMENAAIAQKNQFLNNLSNVVPRPTTDTGYHQYSNSQSTSYQRSYGEQQAESHGTSEGSSVQIG